MLASDIDAIIIATPVFLHADHFEAAVKSGKHIYIEKPASVDVEGCKRIMRAADAADRKLEYQLRLSAPLRARSIRRPSKLADSGAIGTIHLGFARFIKSEGLEQIRRRRFRLPQIGTGRRSTTWGSWKNLSGDLIVENNVHSIDVLNWFLGGRPISAIGSGGSTLPKRGRHARSQLRRV